VVDITRRVHYPTKTFSEGGKESQRTCPFPGPASEGWFAGKFSLSREGGEHRTKITEKGEGSKGLSRNGSPSGGVVLSGGSRSRKFDYILVGGEKDAIKNGVGASHIAGGERGRDPAEDELGETGQKMYAGGP